MQVVVLAALAAVSAGAYAADQGNVDVFAGAPCNTRCGNLTGIPSDDTWQACEPGFIQKVCNKTCDEGCHCPKITLEHMMTNKFKSDRANHGFFQLTWVNISQTISRVAYVVYQRWVPDESRPMNYPAPESQICGPLCGDVESAIHSEGAWVDCQAGWVAETVCATTRMVAVPRLQPFSRHENQTCLSLKTDTGREAGCIYFLFNDHHAPSLEQRWQQKFTTSACAMDTCDNHGNIRGNLTCAPYPLSLV